jgi:hypothetical protein
MVDPMGLAAWTPDPNAKYDAETIKKLRANITEEINKMIHAGENSDCADVALAGLIRAASKLKLRVKLAYYANKKKVYFDSSSDDYKSPDAFEKVVRTQMGVINLWDNTKQKPLDKLEAGDLVLYDLRNHNNKNYKGHTMPVLDVKRKDGKLTSCTVAEGHITDVPGEGKPVTKSNYTKDEILGKGGDRWGGPGLKQQQPDKSWKLIAPGGREWNWKSIGGEG